MPIYEYECTKCKEQFERIELSVKDIPTSQCPKCMGVGVRQMSRPGIIYAIFDETAVHKLPDWDQKMRAAEVHDTKVRRQMAKQPPLPHDKGQGIKTYEMEFGSQERRSLESKAQLDNMP